MKVSLIITTYNREDALLAGLNTVLAQSRLPDEIIVADDGSGELTQAIITAFKKKSPIPLIHSYQEDQGFRAARSRNLAISQASGQYLVMVDGDILMHRSFIEDHCRHAQIGQFIQGGRLLLTQTKTEEILCQGDQLTSLSLYSRGVLSRHKMVHSNLLSWLFSQTNSETRGSRTCNFSLWRHDAILVNGFNEAFQGWGREDSEFVVRLFFAGLKRKKLVFNAIGFHLYHPVQKRDALPANDKILRQTTTSKQPRCSLGLDLHLGAKSASAKPAHE